MIKKQYSKKKPVCKLSFSLSTEQIGKQVDVRVLGQFNDWSWEKGLVLKAKKKSYEGSIELEAGNSYEFRYLVNGHQWFNDEAADDYVPTPFFSHNSLVVLDAVEIAKPAKKATVAKKAAAPKKAKPATTKAKTVAKKATVKKAAPKKAAPKVKADDLKKIEGIGPKIAGLLKADGILSFSDLSKAKLPKLQAVLDAAGPRFKMHQPTTWAQQAKLAAAGKWEELTKLQDELKGGVAK